MNDNKLLLNFTNVKNEETSYLTNFLTYRFSNPKDYRGMHLIQHERLTFERFDFILQVIYDYFNKNDISEILIPSGDIKKHPNDSKGYNLFDYPDFEKLMHELKLKSSQGFKKITLVNLSRMSMIDRKVWIKKEKRWKILDRELVPKKTNKPKFLSLNELTLKYVNLKETESKKELYKNQFLKIWDLFYPQLIDVLKHLDDQKISFIEFNLFFTWIGRLDQNKNVVSSKEIIYLIKVFRSLSRLERETIVKAIQEFANPKDYKDKKKTEKFDFGNFMNETQSIMKIVSESNLLFVNKQELGIDLKKTKDFKFKRSVEEKTEYFHFHSLNHNDFQKKGFEIDHLVPFSAAQTLSEAAMIDNHKNFLLIDAKTHSIKTTNSNKYQILEKSESFEKTEILILKSIDGSFLELKPAENYVADINKIDELIKYNHELLKI